MLKKSRRLFLFALAIIFIAIPMTIVVLVQQVLPTMLIVPNRIVWDRSPSTDHLPENPAKYGLTFNSLDVTTKDGIVLKGWFVHALERPASGTVILLHGWGGCKEYMISMARLLAVHGYNCILYDSRAHGESGGKYCTYGFMEKQDASAYIDAALNRFGEVGPFGIIGVSFGGAVATQVLASDRRFQCGIIVSSFGSLEEATRIKFRALVHCQSEAVLQHVLRIGEKRGGFKVADINPAEIARNITKPTLVIHGQKDSLFPTGDGRRLFENINSTEKEWYLAKNSDHDHIFSEGDVVNVNTKLLTFLSKHLARGP